MAETAQKTDVAPLLKLDLGCGPHPRDGYEGVDAIDFGQPHVVDLRRPWPWADGSVEEVWSSHFFEHLTGPERVHFMNELHRVMVTGAKAFILTPHWSNNRAYGDPTHQWPPISEWACLYWNKVWRDANAPHTGYNCDFDTTYGYSTEPSIQTKNQEHQQFAATHYRNALCDIQFTVVKRPIG